MPMNAEVKQKWVAALRSGEYKQGKNVLTTLGPGGITEHCCLGVLCDLALKEGLPVQTRAVNKSVAESDYTAADNPDLLKYDGMYSVLPDSVQHWAGLASNTPAVRLVGADPSDLPDTRLLLTELNDGWLNHEGYSFEQIADIIEKYL